MGNEINNRKRQTPPKHLRMGKGLAVKISSQTCEPQAVKAHIDPRTLQRMEGIIAQNNTRVKV